MENRFLLFFVCFLLTFQIVSAQNQHKIDSLLNIVQSEKTHDTTRIITYNDIGLAYAPSDPIKAEENVIKALVLAQRIEKPRGMAGAYNCLGVVHYYTKEYDSAEFYFKKALAINQEIGHQWGQASALNQIGVIQDLQAHYEDAIESYKEAASIFEMLKDTASMASTLGNISLIYSRMGFFQVASEYQFQAIRLSEKTKNQAGLYLGYMRITRYYQNQGIYSNALEYANKAKVMAEKESNQHQIANALEIIGRIYIDAKEYDLARDSFEKAFLIRKPVSNQKGLSQIYSGFGRIDFETGNYDSAINYFLQAAESAELKGSKNLLARVHNYIGQSYLALNQLTLANQYALSALDIAKSIKTLEVEKDIYFTLASISEKTGDSDQSLQYYKNYLSLKDSLYSQEKDQKVNELQIQYETEKKDQAIASLQQEKVIAASERKIQFLIATIIVLILATILILQYLKGKRHLELLEKEKEVDRLKSSFFTNISHELRTPLSLILGPLETMLDRENNQDNRYQLGLMKKSALRLLRLVNQILDLSKAESGNLELNVRNIEISKYVVGVAGSFHSLAETRDIQLDINIETNKMIWADESHIETICINLISNSFKYSEAGGLVEVLLRNVTNGQSNDKNDGVELQVIDNGIGISAEHIDHIFDRYYRAGITNEKQFAGTGIGLALVKELVEAHGGSIHVSSELKVGTTVTVRLPVGKNQIYDYDMPSESSKEESTGYRQVNELSNLKPQASPETHEEKEDEIIILLIDDNDDVREYIKTILPVKYTILEAINGEEGIKQAKAFVPDLIISDVMMPIMNGYEVCKYVKNEEITSHIPVILLTAKASMDSRIEGLETEADLYLKKPFHPKELLLYIHNLIQSRKSLQERYNRNVILKPSDIAINSKDEIFLQHLMEVLERNYSDEQFSVEQLSREIGMSRSQLHRKLQALTNESTSKLIRSFRLQRGMELLKKRHASVSEIAYMVGFSSYDYFNKCFVKEYGCTPSTVTENLNEIET